MSVLLKSEERIHRTVVPRRQLILLMQRLNRFMRYWQNCRMLSLMRLMYLGSTPWMFAMKSAIWISSSELMNGLNCDRHDRYVAAFGVEISADCTPSRYRRDACEEKCSSSKISMESVKACARAFADSMHFFMYCWISLVICDGVFRNACTDCTTVSVIVAGMSSSPSSGGAVVWIVFRVKGVSRL